MRVRSRRGVPASMSSVTRNGPTFKKGSARPTAENSSLKRAWRKPTSDMVCEGPLYVARVCRTREFSHILTSEIRQPPQNSRPDHSKNTDAEHNPYSGRRTDRGDLYTFWSPPRPIAVYYRIDGEEVIIITFVTRHNGHGVEKSSRIRGRQLSLTRGSGMKMRWNVPAVSIVLFAAFCLRSANAAEVRSVHRQGDRHRAGEDRS